MTKLVLAWIRAFRAFQPSNFNICDICDVKMNGTRDPQKRSIPPAVKMFSFTVDSSHDIDVCCTLFMVHWVLFVTEVHKKDKMTKCYCWQRNPPSGYTFRIYVGFFSQSKTSVGDLCFNTASFNSIPLSRFLFCSAFL